MRLQIPLIALSATLVVLCPACQKQEPAEVKILKWVDTADPIVDYKAALARGDHRLLAVRGLIVSIPGVDSVDSEFYRQNYGVREIEGTTDGLVNHEHGRLVQKAIDYAKAYNLMMVHAYKPKDRP
jgi:hypothetical protein